MFDLFKSRKSPVRRRVEDVDGVRATHIEWTIENGIRTPTLVVEYAYDLDPGSPDFDADGFVYIMRAVNAAEADEVPPPRVRVVPFVVSG